MWKLEGSKALGYESPGGRGEGEWEGEGRPVVVAGGGDQEALAWAVLAVSTPCPSFTRQGRDHPWGTSPTPVPGLCFQGVDAPQLQLQDWPVRAPHSPGYRDWCEDGPVTQTR